MANWVADFLARSPDAALPIARRARHGIHFQKPNGELVGHFTGKPCHFLDTDNEWKPIDTTLKKIGAEFSAPGIPIRFRADGMIRAGTHSQQTRRIGLFNPTTRTFIPLTTLPDGLVSGDMLIRESGIFRHEMRLTENGARGELIIASMPSGAPTDWLVFETVVSDKFADGDLDDFKSAGYQFHKPVVRDANGRQLSAKRIARRIGNQQFVFSGVPLAELADAVFPVVIDPDFSSSSTDHRIRTAASSFAASRDSANVNYDDGANISAGLNYTGTWYMFRGFVSFDTSSIGAGSTVTQVNLKMTCEFDSSVFDFDVDIRKQDWSGQDPITTGNRATAFANCLSATSDSSIWRATSGMAVNTPYTSGNLSTAYVNKTGKTYYSMISSHDRDNANPGNSDSYVSLYTNGAGTASYRPVLTVVYTTGNKRSFGVVIG